MDANSSAKMIVETLVKAGYVAYYAGGWVRDFVLSHPSDDVDIATSAHPEEVMALFPHTYAVGAAFGVVVVLVDEHQFEVATFRRDDCYVGGRKPESVTFTDPKEDALRRDFTINGMFYDPLTETIYDFVGGREDLKKEVIRAIGNPYERFEEDRLRMIRAVRFSVRFGFPIEEETVEAIKAHAETLLPAVSVERIWQEFCRMIQDRTFAQAVPIMAELGLLSVIFPVLRGTALEDIEKRVSVVADFPEDCPPILFLMELFPHLDIKEKIGISRFLKVTNKDCKIVEFSSQFRELIQKSVGDDPVNEVHAYANPDSQVCLETYAARLSSEERKAFFLQHQGQRWKLGAHIERIQQKNPLVSSFYLREEGIPSGKEMGALLKEAESIAIINDMDSREEVLTLLKQSSHWPVF
ncbi:MAG: poly(A) polymerase [Chlamydiales bacterium]|jgi:poly(A) polymerase